MLYAQATSLFFDEVVTKMVAAFENRCRVTYDRRLASAQRQAAVAAASAIAKLAPSHADAPIILTAANLEAVSSGVAPIASSEVGSLLGAPRSVLQAGFSPAQVTPPPLMPPRPVMTAGLDSVSVVVPPLAPHCKPQPAKGDDGKDEDDDGATTVVDFSRRAIEAIQRGQEERNRPFRPTSQTNSSPVPSATTPQWPSPSSRSAATMRESNNSSAQGSTNSPSSQTPSRTSLSSAFPTAAAAGLRDPYLLRLQQQQKQGPRPAPPLPSGRMSLW
jgi:hypothetical protein